MKTETHIVEMTGKDLIWGIIPQQYPNLMKRMRYGVLDKMQDAIRKLQENPDENLKKPKIHDRNL